MIKVFRIYLFIVNQHFNLASSLLNSQYPNIITYILTPLVFYQILNTPHIILSILTPLVLCQILNIPTLFSKF